MNKHVDSEQLEHMDGFNKASATARPIQQQQQGGCPILRAKKEEQQQQQQPQL